MDVLKEEIKSLIDDVNSILVLEQLKALLLNLKRKDDNYTQRYEKA